MNGTGRLNKESLTSYERASLIEIPLSTSKAGEVVIYDREASLINEILLAIHSLDVPSTHIPKAAEGVNPYVLPPNGSIDDSGSWAREFLSRKNKRLL